MPNKNDLSAYKLSQWHILQASNQTRASDRQNSTAGRKPLPKSEKRSETLVIKLTPQEMNAIDGKRGLADRAVYVRHVLGSQTEVFKAFQ